MAELSNKFCSHAGKVINAEVPAGAALSLRKIEDELEKHKPAVLFLCQVDYPHLVPFDNLDLYISSWQIVSSIRAPNSSF